MGVWVCGCGGGGAVGGVVERCGSGGGGSRAPVFFPRTLS